VIVVDASAFAEVLLRMPMASAVEARLFGRGESLHAPHLVDIEVAHVLRRYALMGFITSARGERALEDFSSFPILRYEHEFLLGRIWLLRNNLSAYDATYVALAVVLRAPLVTRDRRLANAAGSRATIELI
jgi:predicted nucleic acid-binding protein